MATNPPQPTVSVVMPVFNAATSLQSTLDSLAEQTFTNWELIAFNDGSTDSSVQVIENWAGMVAQPVRILSGPNSGPSQARNRAAEDCQGTYLAFLDSDDLWHPDKLERQIGALLKQPKWVGVGCDYQIVSGTTGRVSSIERFDWTPARILDWALMEARGPALCSTLLISAKEFSQVGGFNTALRNLEDLDLALRVSARYSIGNVPSVLCDYIVGHNQNHNDLETVRSAINLQLEQPPFANSRKLRTRLNVNLTLLEARRAGNSGEIGLALGHFVKAFLASPVCVSRTMYKRWKWS
jgi:glycosyltransferase involved in cell wall biosynthesis